MQKRADGGTRCRQSSQRNNNEVRVLYAYGSAGTATLAMQLIDCSSYSRKGWRALDRTAEGIDLPNTAGTRRPNRQRQFVTHGPFARKHYTRAQVVHATVDTADRTC